MPAVKDTEITHFRNMYIYIYILYSNESTCRNKVEYFNFSAENANIFFSITFSIRIENNLNKMISIPYIGIILNVEI